MYGKGGGKIVRVTGGCVTPDWLFGLRSSVIVNGGGRMLLVTYITELDTPAVTLTFQKLILSVVMGGIVRVVVCVTES